jgi:hypothetical protein
MTPAISELVRQANQLMSKQFSIAPRNAYRLAHHVSVDGGRRHRVVASRRYPDTLLKIDGAGL